MSTQVRTVVHGSVVKTLAAIGREAAPPSRTSNGYTHRGLAVHIPISRSTVSRDLNIEAIYGASTAGLY